MTMEHREAAKALMDRGFHIGGSRYMAAKYPNQITVVDDTDWDFYCDDTIEKRVLLGQLGFEKVDAQNRNYWDDLLQDIYKHPALPFEVLIRKDVGIYKSSFDALSAEVFIDRLWKSSPKADPAIKECHIAKGKFRASVCQYFNGIFKLHGWVNPVTEDLW
jgi:hypothetical protein